MNEQAKDTTGREPCERGVARRQFLKKSAGAAVAAPAIALLLSTQAKVASAAQDPYRIQDAA